MRHVITDWQSFGKNRFWRRVGACMDVRWPIHEYFELPTGFNIDTNKMPQNAHGASSEINSTHRQVTVPILGWSLPSVACSERVYYAEGLGDSHNMAYGGKIVIPVTGEYIYQLSGMPIAKSRFQAGHEISVGVDFLFMTKN